MDTYSGEVIDTGAQSPQKDNGPWLWILIALGLLIICVLLIVLVFLLNPGVLERFSLMSSNVRVVAGTYENNIYTAPHKNFTCNFESLMSSDHHPILADGEDEKAGTGLVAVFNDDGDQYGVDYFRVSKAGDGIARALRDPDTRQLVYDTVLNDLVMPSHGKQATVVYAEKDKLDDRLKAVIVNPEGTFNDVQMTGAEEGLDEGYFIFNQGDWVYMVYAYKAPAHDPKSIDIPVTLDEVYKIYYLCEFEP